MRLRQVAFAAHDLDVVVDQLRAALGIEVAFNDPSVAMFGLRNAVMPLGDTFLEVVSPQQAETAAGRYMARRGGDCGYMVMVQTEDSDADRRRAAALAVRIVWSIDLDDIRGTHLHPRDLGGALLSLDSAVPPASWRWAGPNWQRTAGAGSDAAIVGVEMQCAQPDTVARRWASLLDRRVETAPDGTARITLDRGTLRFAAGSLGADGVTTLDIAAGRGTRPRGTEMVICGTRIRLV
jgi:hypothetical protein